MDVVTWKKSYTVGNEQIDDEHKVFIKIIGRINEAVVKQKSLEDIKRIMRELRTYAAFHFVSEENIMIDSAFPELGEHKKEHEKLLITLDRKIEEITSLKEHPRTIIFFLIDWFVDHTTTRDIKLAKHLRYIA